RSDSVGQFSHRGSSRGDREFAEGRGEYLHGGRKRGCAVAGRIARRRGYQPHRQHQSGSAGRRKRRTDVDDEKRRSGIMESQQTDVKEYSYFAGNQWRKNPDNQTFEVHEPYSGKLFARVAAGTRADARIAVDAAAKAFAGWSETTPVEKARLFLKAAEIVKRRRSEIAEVLARETGSTISFATFQQD